MDAWLADAVRVVHVIFVLFVLGGLVVIPAGIVLKAAWVRNGWFRWLHFAASMFLVARIWMGAPCPLTELEYGLRGGRPAAHWTDVLLFRGMGRSQFSAGVMSQGIMSGLLLIVCPPRGTRRRQFANF